MKSKIVTEILLLLIVVVFWGCKKQTSDNNNDNENWSNSEVMVTTYDPQNVTETTVVCGGDVIVLQQGLSLSQLGVCWSANENPTIDDCHLFTWNWNEPFVCTLQGLQANTTYHVRAYALRGLIVYYGEDKMFTTLASPVVNTIEVNAITQTSAVGIGDVISEGTTNVTERGFCWNTHGCPTVNDDHINSGSGVGRFSVEITGLVLGTTYYVRAYAINEVGISYGSEIKFTTISDTPSIIAIEEDGYIRDGDTIELGREYRFGFTLASNVVTQEGLASMSVWIDETSWDDVNLSGVMSYRYTNQIVFLNNYGEVARECIIKAVVSDITGKTSTCCMRFVVVDPTDYLVKSDFEWVKTGDSPAIGLEEFGLQWNNNNGCFAKIEPQDGVLLFSFTPEYWDIVITVFGKNVLFSEAIENGIPLSTFDDIHVDSSWCYDYVLGTVTIDGNYHLIHITLSITSNTTVRVTGETK